MPWPFPFLLAILNYGGRPLMWAIVAAMATAFVAVAVLLYRGWVEDRRQERARRDLAERVRAIVHVVPVEREVARGRHRRRRVT